MNIIRNLMKNKLPVKGKNEERLIECDERQANFIKIIDEQYGNKNSFIKRKSVDAFNEPIPWFTYPSIEYLNQLDLSSKSFLEWGIGNSTLYFAKRCKEIISIEHNSDWHQLIKDQLPGNAKGVLISQDEYSIYPFKFNKKFDVIVVDGIKRFDCLKTALQILKDDGFIIFDNSDRNPEYCKYLRDNNLIEIDFHGFGPIVNFTTTTSIFFSRTVNLKPITIQPVIPIGGGY
jgi:hypothetical protein